MSILDFIDRGIEELRTQHPDMLLQEILDAFLTNNENYKKFSAWFLAMRKVLLGEKRRLTNETTQLTTLFGPRNESFPNLAKSIREFHCELIQLDGSTSGAFRQSDDAGVISHM